MQNELLEGIIRLLDLNVEIKGSIPNEEITIGFGHDSMKNYFLICGMITEKSSNILGEKLIVEDVFLVKFAVEAMKEIQEFKEKLKKQ